MNILAQGEPIDVTFNSWWTLVEIAMEKCFDFGSFAGNLINVVAPVKMVINSHT